MGVISCCAHYNVKKYYINYRGMVMGTKNKHGFLLLACFGAIIAGSCGHVSGSDVESSNPVPRRISPNGYPHSLERFPSQEASPEQEKDSSRRKEYNAAMQGPLSGVCGVQINSEASSRSTSRSSDDELLAAMQRHIPNGPASSQSPKPANITSLQQSAPLGGYVFPQEATVPRSVPRHEEVPVDSSDEDSFVDPFGRPATESVPGYELKILRPATALRAAVVSGSKPVAHALLQETMVPSVVPHEVEVAARNNKSPLAQDQLALHDQRVLGQEESAQSQETLVVNPLVLSSSCEDFGRGVQEPDDQCVSDSDKQAVPSESCWRRFLYCCVTNPKK